MSRFAASLCLFFACLFLTSSGFAAGSHSSRPIRGAAVPGTFIVLLENESDPAQVARDYGLKPNHLYSAAVRGFAANMSTAQRDAVFQDHRVRVVEQDRIVTPSTLEPNAPWNLDRIDQHFLPLDGNYVYFASGVGVTAYIIDTGINFTHQDFNGRAVFGFDALGAAGSDCNGHGTHIAGILGGFTYGVAKSVTLVSVRVADCTGASTVSMAVAGIDWVTQHHATPAVANISLEGVQSSVLDTAVTNMIASGVSTSVAAGNDSVDACGISPADVPTAMTVGASDQNDQKPSWSNFGNCVTFFAPGVNVTSDYFSTSTSTATFSGTSVAAPHAAGVAALFLESHLSAMPDEVKSAIYGVATKNVIALSNSVNNNLIFSLVSAIEPTPAPTATPAPSPTATPTATPTPLPTATPTPTPVPTAAPSPTASPIPSATPCKGQGQGCDCDDNPQQCYGRGSDHKAPRVRLTAPADGETFLRGGVITAKANATDNIGVARVNFYVNSKLMCSEARSPYACTFKMNATPNDVYRIQAVAFDLAGNRTASQIVSVWSY